jgi:hypothetical protein
MADQPTVDAGAYQDLDVLRQRIDYTGEDIFTDNEQLRFDELLVRLERESRKIFETLWGDQTPAEETGRTDVKRATYDAAIKLVYPINSVSKVEYKRTLDSDWEELDSNRYQATDHHLVLSRRPATDVIRHRHAGSQITELNTRSTWADLAEKLRISYDRGFDPVPYDIQSVQVQLINQMLRKLKGEQNIAAASPDELAQMAERNEVVTEEIRSRISDVTSPGRATHSV